MTLKIHPCYFLLASLTYPYAQLLTQAETISHLLPFKSSCLHPPLRVLIPPWTGGAAKGAAKAQPIVGKGSLEVLIKSH